MSESNLKVYSVLLAGGSGTRLWPVSRELFPKQLVKFFGNQSLIQQTIQRMLPFFRSENLRIVCGSNHASEIFREIEMLQVSKNQIMIEEPCGRNTAPAILLAILNILSIEKDAIIYVFPADHVIKDKALFIEKIQIAQTLCQNDHIVTFGIEPHYPETGYGYIEASDNEIDGARAIKRFVEKPDLQTAKQYLQSGSFYWNSGMFAFKASVMLNEYKRFAASLLNDIQTMFDSDSDIPSEDYEKIDNISIDYAIMEHTDKGVVLPSNFGWSDIGSWKSLYDFLAKDKDGNVIISDNAIVQNTKNSFIMAQGYLTAINNLDNMVVVVTPDSVFMSDLETSREVKQIVEQLKEKGRREYQVHSTVYKEWGYRKNLESTNELAVNHLVIFPGKTICEEPVQVDKKWLIQKGCGTIYLDEISHPVIEGHVIRIGSNCKYSLENSAKEVCHIIETIDYIN